MGHLADVIGGMTAWFFFLSSDCEFILALFISIGLISILDTLLHSAGVHLDY